MHDFITRHASKVTGVLRGFDRLLFRGHLLRLNYAKGVAAFLRRQGALLKDFGKFVEQVTAMIREETANTAAATGRPAVYLESSALRKEDVARRLLAKQPVEALVTVGLRAARIADGARAEGMPETSIVVCHTAEEARGSVMEIAESGDVVLVKASRVMGLESVVEGIVHPDV